MASLVDRAVDYLHMNQANNPGSSYFAMAKNYSDYVSAQQAAAAERQNAFQIEQNAKAMAFNASEAEKNREWQKMMSDTAHQREVQDLIAAGLNPVLSATGGNGAAVTSGATASGVTSSGSKADVDNSAMSAIVGQMEQIMKRQTEMQLQTKQLENAMDIAKMQNQMSEFLGLLSADTSRFVAGVNADSARTVAGISAAAQRAVAEIAQSGAMDRLQEELGWKVNHPQTLAALFPWIADSFGVNPDPSSRAKDLYGNPGIFGNTNLGRQGQAFADIVGYLIDRYKGRKSSQDPIPDVVSIPWYLWNR